jgi:hypothetical protein
MVQYMRGNLPFHQSRLEVAETTRDWRTGRLSSVWLTHTREKAKFTIVSAACTDFMLITDVILVEMECILAIRLEIECIHFFGIGYNVSCNSSGRINRTKHCYD